MIRGRARFQVLKERQKREPSSQRHSQRIDRKKSSGHQFVMPIRAIAGEGQRRKENNPGGVLIQLETTPSMKERGVMLEGIIYKWYYSTYHNTTIPQAEDKGREYMGNS